MNHVILNSHVVVAEDVVVTGREVPIGCPDSSIHRDNIGHLANIMINGGGGKTQSSDG